MIPRDLRQKRALKAQKSRSVVKSLPAPTGGWNARDAISDMPPTDAVALVNFFPETTDVILRYGDELWNNLSGTSAANALQVDGVSGYATTPDAAAIDVSGDIDLRAYANLDDWSTASPQFLLAKGAPSSADASYQFFVLNGYLGALLYSTAGATAAFLSDTAAPASDGAALWVRVTVDIDNGGGFAVATFYTSTNGTTWTQLGTAQYQTALASIKNSAQPLELGRGEYPSSVSYYPPPVICDSAEFDGTNDYMSRGALTGATDSKKGIFSGWIRVDAAITADKYILYGIDGVATFQAYLSALHGQIFITGNVVASATPTLLIATAGSYKAATSTWIHILSSWDLSISAASLYISDVADLIATTVNNNNIDYTLPAWDIGATSTGFGKWSGCLAEVYFAPGQYLDFSVQANRRKFITAAGKSAFIGTDGSLPTGTAPLVYQHLADLEAAADFATNRGTGGNFAVTGALATGSNSPSD